MKDLTLNDQICSHRNCLESFAMKFTRDVEDANDLVQDTIVKAIRYHAQYQPGTNLRAWLFTIMRNTFINDYRKQSRKVSLIDTSEELSSFQLRKSADRNNGEGKFMLEDINKALEKLLPEHRIPFLRYFEGFKYQEIADELNIPIGTVKTRIFMARQMLKHQLKMYSDQFGKSRQML